jgi:hypothetical protein
MNDNADRENYKVHIRLHIQFLDLPYSFEVGRDLSVYFWKCSLYLTKVRVICSNPEQKK